MWYNVPAEKPKIEEKLPPIFPWEEREVPKPTRKFVEDEPLPPPLPKRPNSSREFSGPDVMPERPGPGTIEQAALNNAMNNQVPFEAGKNAWDEISGIENYVRALTVSQRNRGKVQVLQNVSPPQPEQTHILSPTNEPDPQELIEKVQKRRESLILTDFPTAVERPRFARYACSSQKVVVLG